jgi:hypothetical protein
MDGGEIFQPSVRVSEAPASFAESNWRVSQFTTGGGHPDPDTRGSNFSGALRVDIWPGHTVGMTAAADGKFFPFWVDNRTGVGQIWAAPVSVAGRAYRNGSVVLRFVGSKRWSVARFLKTIQDNSVRFRIPSSLLSNLMPLCEP